MKLAIPALATLLASASPCFAQQDEVHIFRPPDPQDVRFEFFGESVAISGGWAAVGDPSAAYSETPKGAVVFYRRTPDGWVRSQVERGTTSSRFGALLSMHGEWAAVSAPTWDWGNTYGGKVYLYQRRGETWVRTQDFTVHGQVAFGWGLEISGDVLAIRAKHDKPNKDGTRIMVYERRGDVWVFAQQLVLPFNDDTRNLHHAGLGTSIAIEGDRMVAGAPGGDYGAVYVYDRDASGAWIQTAVLKDPTPQQSDGFGFSVDVAGTTIVVGEPRINAWAYPSGSALVFKLDGSGNWTFQQELKASDASGGGDYGDEFGGHVQLEGGHLLVSGPNAKELTGTIYLFERDGGGQWTEVHQMVPFGGPKHHVGHDLDVDGGIVFAGTNEPVGVGLAYVFEIELGEAFCPATTNSTGVPGRLAVTGSEKVANGELVLSARDCPPGAPGMFFLGDKEASLPLGKGTLCVGRSLLRLPHPKPIGPTGHAVRELDFSDPKIAGSMVAGTTWHFQLGFRDGSEMNLTNAVRLTLE